MKRYVATASASGHRVRGNDDRRKSRSQLGANLCEHRVLLDPGLLVAEEERAVTDGDDVVVKHTGVDCGGELLREHAVRGIDPVTARERC